MILLKRLPINTFLNSLFIILFSSLYIFTPANKYQRMIVLLFLFAMWFLTTIAIEPKWFWKTNVCISILFYVFMIAIDWILTEVTHSDFYFQQCITHKFWVYLWFVIFLFYINHIDLLKRVIPVMLILTFISAIITLVGNIQYPGASRLLAGTKEYYVVEREFYKSMNIGGYDFIYSIVFLSFPIFMLVRYKIKPIKVYALLLVIFVLTVFVSSYFIGILLVVSFGVCTIFLPKNLIRYSVLMLFFLGLIVLFKNNLLQLLVDFGITIKSEILVKRANELITMSYISDYGEGNRLALYINGFLNFLDHPFLGNIGGLLKDSRPSGHSAILNYLEYYGCFSFVYYFFIKKVYLYTKKQFINTTLRNSYFIFYILFIGYMFVDVFDTAYGLGFTVFFLVPSLFLLLEDKQQEN